MVGCVRFLELSEAGARIVVFPGLSLTGYDLHADLVDPADRRLAPLEAACARTGSLALVGAPVGGDGGPFIAMLAEAGTEPGAIASATISRR